MRFEKFDDERNRIERAGYTTIATGDQDDFEILLTIEDVNDMDTLEKVIHAAHGDCFEVRDFDVDAGTAMVLLYISG